MAERASGRERLTVNLILVEPAPMGGIAALVLDIHCLSPIYWVNIIAGQHANQFFSDIE